jgi:PAS domain S-box-containing protein
MELLYERKLEMNHWLVKARWFYGIGIFVIGLLSKILSQSNVNFSFGRMLALLFFFYSINVLFILYLRRIEKDKNKRSIQIISWLQMALEIAILVAVLHSAGGIESISFVFFFVPITSAAFLFSNRGSIITALISALFLNGLVLLEYYRIIPHVSRYGQTTIEFANLSVALTKSISVSIFYIIAGFYSGYCSKLLYAREGWLDDKTKEIIKVNSELDKRISDLNIERKKAEAAHNKTAAIISNLADPIIVLNRENKISLINLAAESILGLSKNDLGKKISSHHNFSLDNFQKVISRELQVKKIAEIGNEEIAYEELSISYENQNYTYKVATAKINDRHGNYLGIMKIFNNITREKALDQAKSEFISIAAHQLRTPLSAIKWCLKLLIDGDEGKMNDGQKELLTKGYISNERIINLVNDLLNVSRIEAGSSNYTFSPESFTEALTIVSENLEGMIKENKINLIVQVDKNLPEVLLDKQKIILVLQNLLENAVKYTPRNGKIEIIIKVKNKNLEVKIKDNGVGIPAEDQKMIFSKFFRARNAVKLQTEGSGLGLFICKSVIEAHQGQLSYSSREGEGTEFIFTLPILEKKQTKV